MAEGSGEGGPQGPQKQEKADRRFNTMRYIAVPLIVALIGLVGVILPMLRSSNGSAADSQRTATPAASLSRSPSPSPSAVTQSTASTAHAVWNHSTLTLAKGMNANLDSRSADFDRARSMNWPPGNVAYDKSDGAPGYTLYLKDSPATTTALGTAGNWDYDTCATATYGGDANAPVQDNIAAGHGLCFDLREDTGHWYVLIKVLSQDPTQITMDVTSWQL